MHTSKNRLVTLTLEFTPEQEEALLRVLNNMNCTVGEYCLEMILSGLENDDQRYGAMALSRSLGLPANTSRAQLQAYLRQPA